MWTTVQSAPWPSSRRRVREQDYRNLVLLGVLIDLTWLHSGGMEDIRTLSPGLKFLSNAAVLVTSEISGALSVSLPFHVKHSLIIRADHAWKRFTGRQSHFADCSLLVSFRFYSISEWCSWTGTSSGVAGQFLVRIVGSRIHGFLSKVGSAFYLGIGFLLVASSPGWQLVVPECYDYDFTAIASDVFPFGANNVVCLAPLSKGKSYS
ncbi:hypothetical protein NMY22_g18066 [Coprinellus aureogranulatus]|nr:hypothetical protein NMY22_g18066 [Coprinellus aureogranulatus]